MTAKTVTAYDVAVQFTLASFPGSSDEPGNEAKFTPESCDVPESCECYSNAELVLYST